MAHIDSLQINDLVFDFYFDATQANHHTFNDQLFEALGDAGFTGSLQDRQMAWLGAGGYTGTLQDRLYAWTGAQGEVGAINDRIRDYYLDPGPGPVPPTPAELVTDNGKPVWYLNQTNFVVFHEL
tara:strand:- start:723 stop:1097 length:375 start_codon:yes stop_codon:yes gene_type:complete